MNGHVDGVALGKVAGRGVARVDVGEIATTPQEGLGVAVFVRKGDIGVDVVLDVGILCKILVNQFGSFFARDTQLFAEAKRADAVYDAEVDGLGIAAQVLAHLFHRDAVDFGSGGGMNVVVVGEGVNHVAVMGKGGDDAQLDLRVVGGQQDIVVVAGHKGAADFAAPFGAYGDVLQVRIAAGKASGGGDSLIVDGVETVGDWVDELGKAVEISADELGERTVFEYLLDDGMALFEFEKHIFGGRILLGGGAGRLVGDFKLLVQHFAQLFGG